MTGLRKAVIAYNRAAAELDIARKLLGREIDADRVARAGTRREQAECGTRGGYNKHVQREEPACPACTEAHRRDHARSVHRRSA